MTLDEAERLLANSANAAALFGGHDSDAVLKTFRVALHPDLFPGGGLDAERAAQLFVKAQAMRESLRAPAVTIKGKKRCYQFGALIASGDVADVHEAIGDGVPYVLKASRVPEGAVMLEQEARALTAILRAASASSYSRMVPTLCESFPVQDGFRKVINVFTREDGFTALDAVHARHPRLPGRHLAWIFKRLLSVLGLAHSAGIVHGAVLPPHCRLALDGHGLQLLGWGQSVQPGQPIARGAAGWLDHYPPEVKERRPAGPGTDVYMAAKLMAWLAGDPDFGDAPAPLRRFWRACLLPGPASRPGDAFALHDEFSVLLRTVYGAPTYVPLEV